jgi:hypothetical protein
LILLMQVRAVDKFVAGLIASWVVVATSNGRYISCFPQDA